MIKYKETHEKPNALGRWKYITYTASTKAEALEFLKTQINIPEFTYICVDTPEGSFCKDILGCYQEL